MSMLLGAEELAVLSVTEVPSLIVLIVSRRMQTEKDTLGRRTIIMAGMAATAACFAACFHSTYITKTIPNHRKSNIKAQVNSSRLRHSSQPLGHHLLHRTTIEQTLFDVP